MPLEDKELEILDAYLAQLQAGERPDREVVLRGHPELASALECLEALEKLGPKDALESPAGDEISPHPSPLPKGEGTVPLNTRPKGEVTYNIITKDIQPCFPSITCRI